MNYFNSDITRKKHIDGVVVFLRSEDSDRPCICCNGNHIYSREIKVLSTPSKHSPGLTNDSVQDYISEWMADNQDVIEGRKVRITIELVPTTEELRKAADDNFFDEEYA